MPRTTEPTQLSLFDVAPPADPVPAVPRVDAAPSAPPAAASPPPPPALRHPQAQREVLLGGHRVGYALRRARRRSIGFVVGPEGLAVSAPRWVGIAEIEAALQSKAAWVLRKLHEQAERQRRQQALRIEWRDGATVPFLGEPVIVVLDARVSGAVLDAGAEALPGIARLVLRVGLPEHATPQQIRDAVHGWLQRQARRIFEERCRHFEARLGVRMTRLALSSAATRWGSASADGSIRLHWRLVHLPLASIDYVVAHELAHLREMNHSPAFWDVVRSVIPDVERVRRALREHPLPPDD
ncbi:M48 family metallopeptidase [Calidifontimicrobium sp. SYSU G02091]|uniref:M48 family metallopeptidase n=1 Tax=Calidifontimicrobium sp. SYSU G02091 TaxID=2926421 RepID=UPI001F53DC2D|nr:SprT family zinc-dependent metalloprotease [Calidifontimicrobium sp. SYSU G02091]MCI1190584.1 M48 family metallopeptidase [Calidifontimicrobium sp. SYSU G02091]